jgi:hypothetical protein
MKLRWTKSTKKELAIGNIIKKKEIEIVMHKKKLNI